MRFNDISGGSLFYSTAARWATLPLENIPDPVPLQHAQPSHMKAELRRCMRGQRKQLPITHRRVAAQQLVRNALHVHWILHARRIGLFVPHGSEIDVLPLMRRLIKMGKHVFLPMVSPAVSHRKLWFKRLRLSSRWTANRFGVAEIAHGQRLRAQHLDVLCLPLVAYDAEGYRLGMGGGFYDASLTFLRHQQHRAHPKLIGIAFACQRLNVLLPREHWDVPLDAALNEQGLEFFLSHLG